MIRAKIERSIKEMVIARHTLGVALDNACNEHQIEFMTITLQLLDEEISAMRKELRKEKLSYAE